MTVTTIDIANRALQLVGLQKKISLLTQDSIEAQALNTCMTPIQNWCFGIANWNFARCTAGLALSKGPTPSNPVAWSGTYPSPPWLYEFTLPANFIRAIYITNSDPATAVAGYLGEPQRFVIANDTITGTTQMVLLTNQSAPVLIYTGFISDPTAWPWYFERLAVIALASTVCTSLGNSKRQDELNQKLEQQIDIAMQINQSEGLIIPDSTPEWIQATGINYPYRRLGTADDGSAPIPARNTPAQRQRGPKQ